MTRARLLGTGRSGAGVGCAACAVVLGLARGAAGSAADVVGVGSEAIARGGAVTASATGHEAAFYNPAGLARHGRTELTLGGLYLVPDLEIRTATRDFDQEVVEPGLVLVGAVVPLGKYFAFGYTGYALPTNLMRVVATSPEKPSFPYYANRTQRLTAMPAIAVRPLDWLSVGVGVNFFAGLTGTVEASEGPTREVEPVVAEELPSTHALHAGIHVAPLDELSFGLAYRDRFVAPYATQTESFVAGTSLDVAVDAQALQTPEQIAAGVAVTLGDLQLGADATWLRWSGLRGPFVRVEALVSGVQIDQPPPEGQYRDTYNVRVGLAVERPLGPRATITYRAGQWFEPTMLGDQPGRGNLLDGDKLGFSAGAGVELEDVLPKPFRVDVHGTVVHVASRRHVKRVTPLEELRGNPDALADEDASAPGSQITNLGYPQISGGGRVYTVGLTATFEVGR